MAYPSCHLPALTHGLAGLGEGLQPEALFALAFVAALEVHARGRNRSLGDPVEQTLA